MSDVLDKVIELTEAIDKFEQRIKSRLDKSDSNSNLENIKLNKEIIAFKQQFTNLSEATKHSVLLEDKNLDRIGSRLDELENRINNLPIETTKKEPLVYDFKGGENTIISKVRVGNKQTITISSKDPPIQPVTFGGGNKIPKVSNAVIGNVPSFKSGGELEDSGVAIASIGAPNVLSVFGRGGSIVATSGDYTTTLVTEGASNFYYNQSRFDTSLTTKTTNNLAEGGSGLYYSQQRFNTAFNGSSHNGLIGLQGGASGDYYHLTTPQGTSVNNLVTNNYLSAEGTLGSITWTGNSSPTGAATAQYRWTRNTNEVNFYFRVEYATAGNANTSADFQLPLECPAPFVWTGAGAGDEVVYPGTGGAATSPTAQFAASRMNLNANTGNTGYNITITFASQANRCLHGAISYITV